MGSRNAAQANHLRCEGGAQEGLPPEATRPQVHSHVGLAGALRGQGVQTNINAFEERQATAMAEHAQIQQIGRDQGLNTVDISQVADILSRQERGMP